MTLYFKSFLVDSEKNNLDLDKIFRACYPLVKEAGGSDLEIDLGRERDNWVLTLSFQCDKEPDINLEPLINIIYKN